METQSYEVDLDLEAEIEAFLEEDDDLTQPLWKAELTSALEEQVNDVDILKGIIGSRVLPAELRAQVWPSLLGVFGKSNNFSPGGASALKFEEDEKRLQRDCQRFGENASLAFGIIKSYVSSKDLRYDCEDFVLVLEVLIDLELSDAEKFNTFYAIMTRHRPKSKKQLSSVFDLLVQFFDPSLSRHLQVRRLEITKNASEWVCCGFRNCLSDEVSRGLWDIILQSCDSTLSVFVGLVLILNARDSIIDSSNVPKLDEISLDDLDDLIQLAKFYETKTPKSFISSFISTLFMKNVKSSNENTKIDSFFVIPMSAPETVKDVLNATAGIILDVRPDGEFEQSHLIGSLRLGCVIDPGLMDGIKLRKALEKFAGDINRELAKDEEQDIPFLTLIGSKTSESTLFTCANELVRIGFVGVSAVRGGFKAIHEEVTNLGSEDLLLWQNPEEKQDSLMSSFSWLSNSIAPNLTSAINSINSTLETMLTVEDDEVDTQF